MKKWGRGEYKGWARILIHRGFRLDWRRLGSFLKVNIIFAIVLFISFQPWLVPANIEGLAMKIVFHIFLMRLNDIIPTNTAWVWDTYGFIGRNLGFNGWATTSHSNTIMHRVHRWWRIKRTENKSNTLNTRHNMINVQQNFSFKFSTQLYIWVVWP